jgi:hypothetical protein
MDVHHWKNNSTRRQFDYLFYLKRFSGGQSSKLRITDLKKIKLMESGDKVSCIALF